MQWLSGRTVYSNPQIGEREGDGREGWETDWRIFSNRAKQHPLTFAQLESFQRARQRIDQPGVGDAVMGVQREFQSSILLRGGRREDFAHLVGNDLEPVIAGNGRHPFALPTGQIGHGNFGVTDEMNFGFHQNPPASRPSAAPEVERRPQIDVDRRFRRSMRPGRTRLGVELAADDLAYLVFRQGKQLVVKSKTRNRLGLVHRITLRGLFPGLHLLRQPFPIFQTATAQLFR